MIAAALKSGFQEAKERSITFPEDDPELFNIFANFVYTGYIRSRKPNDIILDRNFDCEWDRLGTMWVLGEKLQAAEFKDAVVDALVEKLRAGSKHPATMHQTVYPGGAGPSGMRRLLVDIAAWTWSKTQLESTERKEEWVGFFFDLAVKLQTLVGARRPIAPWKTDSGPECLYHDHESEKACYKTLFE